MKKIIMSAALVATCQLGGYDTAYQAQEALRTTIVDKHNEVEAARIIRKARAQFSTTREGLQVIDQMTRFFIRNFQRAPEAVEPQAIVQHKNAELEERCHQVCAEIETWKAKAHELEEKFLQEKTINEKMYQELMALSVTGAEKQEQQVSESALSLMKVYEQLKQAFGQYEREFGSTVQKNNFKEKYMSTAQQEFKPLDRREAELRGMLEQWDAIMYQLRVLSQKADEYEKMRMVYDQREEELKRTAEQRDLVERQLRDLHRKFDQEQSKNKIALNDAASQLEAVRNQLADVKNQLSMARKQQQTVQKSQEVEKQLQAERLAYEGALSDERMQRQKLRQQVQELQKRLDLERTSYEKRILALEQEVVLLIDKLPANAEGKRSGVLAPKWEVKKEPTEQKEEKRRI